MKISKLEIEDCTTNTYLINTVVDSLYSSLISSIDTVTQGLLKELESHSTRDNVIEYVLLAAIALSLMICLITDLVFTKYIASYEVKIMDIFLDIPRKYVLFLNNQCETYMAELQVILRSEGRIWKGGTIWMS